MTKISLEFVFALQVYLDIAHVTRVDLPRTSRDLTETGKRIEEIVTAYYTQSKTEEIKQVTKGPHAQENDDAVKGYMTVLPN